MTRLPLKGILVGWLLFLPFVYPPQSISTDQVISNTMFQRYETEKEARLGKIETVLRKYKTGLSQTEKSNLAELIYEESVRHHFDPELIMALVIKESSFYNWSVSRVGALGLMQIRPTTGREMAEMNQIPWSGKKTLFDPRLNIKLGTRYLASLQNRFGKLDVALAAYNYGPSRISKMLKRGDPLPTVYAYRILNIYQRFLELEPSELAQSWDPDDFKKDEGKKPKLLYRI